MNTYILTEIYGDKIRINVSDNVQVSIDSYNNGQEGGLVKFTTQGSNYTDNVIAAFSRVSRVYLEGTDIQEESCDVEHPQQEPYYSAKKTRTWKTI